MIYQESHDKISENAVVMICKHVFEWGFVPLCADSRQFCPRKQFKRDDGTTGECDWQIACYKCKDNKNADFVEMLQKDGKLHPADFHQPEGVLQ